MIRSFKNQALERFFSAGDRSKLSVQNSARVARILRALHAATAPEAMNVPGYKFHGLKDRDRSRYAVWVSGNYRITFAFDG